MTRSARAAALLVLLAACGPAAPAAPPGAPQAPPQQQPAPQQPPQQSARQIKYDVETPPVIEHLGPRGKGEALDADGAVAMIHYIGRIASTGVRFGGTVPDDMAGTAKPFDEPPADPDKRAAAPRPFVVELGRGHIVTGLDMTLRALRVGDHVKATVRSDLAYGDAGVEPAIPVIPRRAELVYEIWVVGKVPPLTWEVLEQGKGPQARNGAIAVIHFTSRTPDGALVEDTRVAKRGATAAVVPIKFHVNGGEVLEAFDRVVSQLRVGDRVRVRVPWFYDRGAAPRVIYETKIPAMTDLVYEIDFLAQEGN